MVRARAAVVSADGVDLNGRSVLVAGATGGLGSAIASVLAQRGAVLTLVSRRQGALADLTVPGRRCALDLRQPENCTVAVGAAIEHGGALDVVVNAVGVVAFGGLDELTLDTMEELFLTNTFVPIMLTQAALRGMAEGGSIVNLSGIVAEQNVPGMAAYGASKAATRSFDEAIAREARRRNIRVVDARPPHSETGLASRPIDGTAPPMAPGLDPSFVAGIVVAAIESGATDLPSTAFRPA